MQRLHSYSLRYLRAFIVGLASACIFTCALPGSSFADVRSSDVVSGLTVEQRGLAASQSPDIVANYAIAVDEDGKVYFERNADEQVQIASITKTMTAIVALEYGDLEDTTITVSKNAASIGESSAMLQAGDSMNLDAALKAMMICSGNDAATAIAESMGSDIKQSLNDAGDPNVPEDSQDAFVYAMNKEAKKLDMDDSLFANPHGLDFDDYAADMHCSARDVAKMCSQAMSNEAFRDIVATDKTKIKITRNGSSANVKLESTDILLGNYDGACGIKTGFTEKAGECFAGAVQRDGKLLFSIVLDSSSEAQRFTDSQTLDDWVFDNTVQCPLASSSETVDFDTDNGTVSAPVVAQVSHTGWMDKTFKATIADPTATVEVFALDGNVSQDVQFDAVSGDVHPGTKVGTVTYYQHNEVVATQDLVAAEDCAAPNIIEGIGIWWHRLFNFSGQPTQATSEVVGTMPVIYGANATS